MTAAKYFGGLPEGEPGQSVDVLVDTWAGAADVVFKHLWGKWSYRVPLLAITGMRLDRFDKVTAKRIILTGLLAFGWKKKEYTLLIDAEIEGLDSEIALQGKQADLATIHRKIMEGRRGVAERP